MSIEYDKFTAKNYQKHDHSENIAASIRYILMTRSIIYFLSPRTQRQYVFFKIAAYYKT